jgi:UPF0716 family protein affecting phage T7 exclusion
MHPVKAIAISVLAWPAAEIVAFFCVAAAVGFGNALLLVVLMSVAGFLVLRHFGGGEREILTPQGRVRISTWSGGLSPGLAGVFLLIPGFLTSVLGLAIMFPLTRRWLAAGFGRLLTGGGRKPSGTDVIELAPTEWRPLPSTKLAPAGDTAEQQKRQSP